MDAEILAAILKTLRDCGWTIQPERSGPGATRAADPDSKPVVGV